MKPIVAILPNNEITSQIMSVRKILLTQGLAGKDNRYDVIPHASVYYFKEINHSNILDVIIKNLRESSLSLEMIKMDVVRIRTWSNKVALMMDNKPVRNLYRQLRIVLKDFPTENDDVLLNLNQLEQAIGEKTYSNFEEISADHIKIARNISDNKVPEVMDYINKSLPKTIIFNRLVLIDFGCTERDILWEKRFTY